MNYIYYTKEFKNNIPVDIKADIIYKKIEDLQYIDKLENYKPIDKYARGLLVLKFSGANLCRVIIQPQQIEIEDDKFTVLFIRDIITKKSFDYFWGSVVYPLLNSGQWINKYPLPKVEI